MARWRVVSAGCRWLLALCGARRGAGGAAAFRATRRLYGCDWRDIADVGDPIRVNRGPYVWMSYAGGSGHWYLSRRDGQPLPGGERMIVVPPSRVPPGVRAAA